MTQKARWISSSKPQWSTAAACSMVLAKTREAKARPASIPTKNQRLDLDIPGGIWKGGWIEYHPLFPTRGFIVSQTIRSKQQRNVLRSSHQTSPSSKHEMAEMQQEEPPMCAVCNHRHHQVTLKDLVVKTEASNPSLVSALFELEDLLVLVVLLQRPKTLVCAA